MSNVNPLVPPSDSYRKTANPAVQDTREGHYLIIGYYEMTKEERLKALWDAAFDFVIVSSGERQE